MDVNEQNRDHTLCIISVSNLGGSTGISCIILPYATVLFFRIPACMYEKLRPTLDFPFGVFIEVPVPYPGSFDDDGQ